MDSRKHSYNIDYESFLHAITTNTSAAFIVHAAGEPVAIGGFTPIEEVYNYNPIPKELDENEKKYIIGAQANVWTEYMKTSEHVEYMVFPRILALSEVLWSSNRTNFTEFKLRAENYFKRLDKLDINYSKHLENEETK